MRWVFLFAIALIGCNDINKTLPSSTGENSEVIFVVEDALWKNLIDSLANRIFGVEIKGINQPESLFSIVQINHTEFNSILKTHKNIVIISEGVKKSTESNKWSKNQFVAQLNFDQSSLRLIKDLIQLREVILLKELNRIKKSLKKSSQVSTEEVILSYFGVDCVVPKEYEIINNDSILFWAAYNPNTTDEIKKIIIFSFAPKTANLQSEVLSKIDSVFNKHLKGAKDGSFVKIEPNYPPYYFENIYRGLWKMQGGFMGGPFLAKTYFVKEKIVVNVGLVFAPQNRKRRYVKEFEAIL